jgi:hypothetical protein
MGGEPERQETVAQIQPRKYAARARESLLKMCQDNASRLSAGEASAPPRSLVPELLPQGMLRLATYARANISTGG